MNWLERLLGWLRVERHDIGRKGVGTYLTRWVLWGTRYGDKPARKVFLHKFWRGDVEPYCHDHPWPFVSVILWGGYWEVTPCPAGHPGCQDVLRKWYGPGSVLRRPADWQHRVEVPEGRHCWTLLYIGLKVRSWGFICPGRGWLPWREHEANQAAGRPGCGGDS